MKLFLRDHIPLLLFNTTQLFFVMFIYLLDGYQNLPTAFYSVFFGFFLLVGYLIFRYWTHRNFYKQLSNPVTNLDQSIQTTDSSRLSRSLQTLMKIQYRFYQEKIHRYENKQQQHLTFINQWVHQMKTPLSVIHLTLKGKIDPIFESIREEADRIGKGLETILYTARLEVFEHDFYVESVYLQPLVNEVISENKRSFIRHHVFPKNKVKTDFHVNSDAKWLFFILNQLITNAIHYSSGVGETIKISSYQRGENTILEVQDRGIGIPTHDIHRVFDPYFTGENGRKYRESTGMGLYLVHEVCEKLNHGIEIKSKVGEGTSVRIIFSNVH